MSSDCKDNLFPISVGGMKDEQASCIIHDEKNQQIIVAGNSSSENFVPAANHHGFAFAVDFEGNWKWGKFYYNVSFNVETISGCNLDSNGSMVVLGIGNSVPIIMELNPATGDVLKYITINKVGATPNTQPFFKTYQAIYHDVPGNYYYVSFIMNEHMQVLKISDQPNNSFTPPTHNIEWNYAYYNSYQVNYLNQTIPRIQKAPRFLLQDQRNSDKMLLLGQFLGAASVIKFDKRNSNDDYLWYITGPDSITRPFTEILDDVPMNDILSYVYPANSTKLYACGYQHQRLKFFKGRKDAKYASVFRMDTETAQLEFIKKWGNVSDVRAEKFDTAACKSIALDSKTGQIVMLLEYTQNDLRPSYASYVGSQNNQGPSYNNSDLVIVKMNQDGTIINGLNINFQKAAISIGIGSQSLFIKNSNLVFAGQSTGFYTKFQNSTYYQTAPNRDVNVWKLNTDKVDTCFYNDQINASILNRRQVLDVDLNLNEYYKSSGLYIVYYELRHEQKNQFVASNSRYSGAFNLLDTMRYPRMCAKSSINMTGGVDYYKGQKEVSYRINQSTLLPSGYTNQDLIGNGQVWIFQNGSSAQPTLGRFDSYNKSGPVFVYTNSDDAVGTSRTIIRGCSKYNELLELYLYVRVNSNGHPDFVSEIETSWKFAVNDTFDYKLPQLIDKEGNDVPEVYITAYKDKLYPPFLSFNNLTNTLSFRPDQISYQGNTYQFAIVVKEKNSDVNSYPYYCEVKINGKKIDPMSFLNLTNAANSSNSTIVQYAIMQNLKKQLNSVSKNNTSSGKLLANLTESLSSMKNFAQLINQIGKSPAFANTSLNLNAQFGQLSNLTQILSLLGNTSVQNSVSASNKTTAVEFNKTIQRIMISNGSETSSLFGGTAAKLLSYQQKSWVNTFSEQGFSSCTHTEDPHIGQSLTFNLSSQTSIKTIKLLNRGDCCQQKAYGLQIFAGSKLCGTWPQNVDGWASIDCDGAVSNYIKIVQPREYTLTICGIEVHGYPQIAPKGNEVKIKIPQRINLTNASQSSRDGLQKEGFLTNTFIKRTEWISYGFLQNGDWNFEACTHTKQAPDTMQWEQYDWKGLYQIQKVRLLSRQDTRLSRRYINLKIYVGETLCGNYPQDYQAGSFVEIRCPNGTIGSFVKIKQAVGESIQTCGIEVYGIPFSDLTTRQLNYSLTLGTNLRDIFKQLDLNHTYKFDSVNQTLTIKIKSPLNLTNLNLNITDYILSNQAIKNLTQVHQKNIDNYRDVSFVLKQNMNYMNSMINGAGTSNQNFIYLGKVKNMSQCIQNAYKDVTNTYQNVVYTSTEGTSDKSYQNMCYGNLNGKANNPVQQVGVVTAIATRERPDLNITILPFIASDYNSSTNLINLIVDWPVRFNLTRAYQSSNSTLQKSGFMNDTFIKRKNWSSYTFKSGRWNYEACTSTGHTPNLTQWEQYILQGSPKEVQLVRLLSRNSSNIRGRYTKLQVYVGKIFCGNYPQNYIPGQFVDIRCPPGTIGDSVKILQTNLGESIQTCGIEVYGREFNTYTIDKNYKLKRSFKFQKSLKTFQVNVTGTPNLSNYFPQGLYVQTVKTLTSNDPFSYDKAAKQFYLNQSYPYNLTQKYINSKLIFTYTWPDLIKLTDASQSSRSSLQKNGFLAETFIKRTQPKLKPFFANGSWDNQACTATGAQPNIQSWERYDFDRKYQVVAINLVSRFDTNNSREFYSDYQFDVYVGDTLCDQVYFYSLYGKDEELRQLGFATFNLTCKSYYFGNAVGSYVKIIQKNKNKIIQTCSIEVIGWKLDQVAVSNNQSNTANKTSSSVIPVANQTQIDVNDDNKNVTDSSVDLNSIKQLIQQALKNYGLNSQQLSTLLSQQKKLEQQNQLLQEQLKSKNQEPSSIQKITQNLMTVVIILAVITVLVCCAGCYFVNKMGKAAQVDQSSDHGATEVTQQNMVTQGRNTNTSVLDAGQTTVLGGEIGIIDTKSGGGLNAIADEEFQTTSKPSSAKKESREDRRKRLEKMRKQKSLRTLQQPQELIQGDIKSKVTGETGDIIGEIWTYYDNDGSGTLSKSEIQEFIEDATGIMNFPQAQFDALFIEFDKDKSGNLCRNEVEALIKEVLKIDAKQAL